GMCGTCEGSKSGDIFQIFITGVSIMWFVGVLPAIKITAIVLIISVVRYFLFKKKKETKEPTLKTKKNCCEDNFL
ncbi:MAG: hypothetical protein ACRCX2_24260, partial [Paraclostridium sp.]